MATSIIKGDIKSKCYFCGATGWIEEHHVFGGNPNRRLSEKYGLKVHLCHYCHNEPPQGVHYNLENRLMLQQIAQTQAMEHYGWSVEDFIHIFGKNYL